VGTHSSLIHSIEQSRTTASQKNAQQRQTNKHNIGAAFGEFEPEKKKKEKKKRWIPLSRLLYEYI
jgi:hypothetical protein